MKQRRMALLGIVAGVGLAGFLLRPEPQTEPHEGPPQRLASLDGLRPVQWLSETALIVERDTLVAPSSPSYRRYELTTGQLSPAKSPQHTAVPRWPHDDGSTGSKPVWIGTTREGYPLFASPYDPDLIEVRATERKVPLSYPKGLSFATAPEICGEFFVSDGPRLTPEGNAVLAVLQSTDNPEAHPLTFWRLPLNGDTAQKLATLPSERHGLGAVRLSPDKKRLIYWIAKRAYTKTLGFPSYSPPAGRGLGGK